MAEYDTHKRKYDDEDTLPPPPRRRTTGFSDGPPSQAPPPQYGSVPPPQSAPPVDDFAAIKQSFQQLASRALSNSNITSNNNNTVDSTLNNKRSKFDDTTNPNPTSYSANYNSYSDQKPVPSSNQYGSTPSGAASYGYSGSGNKKIEIPNGRVGVIIGKAGETIKYLQNQSGARIQITRDSEHDPHAPNRGVELTGTPDQIAKAEELIHNVIAEADTGGPGAVSRKMPAAPGSEQFVMKVASNKVGLVIGKGGETIKNIQSQSGARVQVIPLHPPPGDMSNERTVQIDGTSEQIEIAKQMVYEVTENRNRNPGMTGGYSQQGYQARPQTNWASQPPQPPQGGGYNYMQQPGGYPGAPPQYGQQPYAGYPPQPTSGGYPQSYDPSGAPQTQQAQGYDYYGQQATQQQNQPSGTPTDNSGYNYNQAPTSGAYGQQGYSQEGYAGGYQAPTAQSGYGQAPENPQSGYDQQQGYGSTPGYANPTNTQSQDGSNPSSYTAQGEAAQAPPAGQPQGYTGQPGYGVPPTSQPGYGAPPTAQAGYGSGYGQPQGQRTPPPPNAPASYGQPQQSPSQPGYAQPAQPGYSQTDGGASRPAAAAYPGAYPTPYGAPPSYGQQPPAYYGGGYSQPPSYPAEGNGSAATGTPSPAAAQPTGAAKRTP